MVPTLFKYFKFLVLSSLVSKNLINRVGWELEKTQLPQGPKVTEQAWRKLCLNRCRRSLSTDTVGHKMKGSTPSLPPVDPTFTSHLPLASVVREKNCFLALPSSLIEGLTVHQKAKSPKSLSGEALDLRLFICWIKPALFVSVLAVEVRV